MIFFWGVLGVLRHNDVYLLMVLGVVVVVVVACINGDYCGGGGGGGGGGVHIGFRWCCGRCEGYRGGRCVGSVWRVNRGC